MRWMTSPSLTGTLIEKSPWPGNGANSRSIKPSNESRACRAAALIDSSSVGTATARSVPRLPPADERCLPPSNTAERTPARTAMIRRTSYAHFPSGGIRLRKVCLMRLSCCESGEKTWASISIGPVNRTNGCEFGQAEGGCQGLRVGPRGQADLSFSVTGPIAPDDHPPRDSDNAVGVGASAVVPG